MLHRLFLPLCLCALVLVSCTGPSPVGLKVSAPVRIDPALLQNSASDAWPAFEYNAGHTGSIAGQSNAAPLQGKVLWSKRLGPFFSSAVSGFGMLYLASADGYLYALQQETGAQVWRVQLKNRLTDSTPTLAGQVLFIATQSTKLQALNAQTGQSYWTFAAGEKIQAPPLAIDGRVLVVSQTTLWTLDASTGQLLWKFAAGPQGWPSSGSPTVLGGTVYIGLGSSNKLWALDLANGHPRWSFDTKDRIISAALAQGGRVSIATWHGHIFALDSVTGQQIWSYALNSGQGQQPVDGIGGSMALAHGALFVGDYAGGLLCLDAASGKLRWRFPTGAQILATPIVSGQQVYIGSGDGFFYALNITTGRPSWKYATGEIRASAVLAGGHLYIGSLEGAFGEVYAFS